MTLFHVTHWKAGSQWILRILQAVAPDRIVAPRNGEGQFLFDDIIEGGIYPTVYVTREQYDAVALPPCARRFVVLRDLRDTLVSAYFSMRYSHSLTALGMVDLRSRLDSLSLEDGLILMMEKWLPGAASIHASWSASDEPIVHYEDLLTRDVEILEEALVMRAGLEVDSAVLRRAVEANRFDVLAQGRRAGEEDLLAHERKGISGDWRNHFSHRVSRRFDLLYGSLARDVSIQASPQDSPPVVELGEKIRPIRIKPEDVIASYDKVSPLYPNVPTSSHWLAWEHAAFSRFPLTGRILDLGCADPRFFHLNWPHARDVLGVSTHPGVAEWAVLSRRYREVNCLADFTRLPADASVDHVFSRGSLVSVDQLQPVLAAVQECLRPGGAFLCSVITHRFHEWALLPRLFEVAGYPEAAASVQSDYVQFHGITQARSGDDWQAHFVSAGFLIEQRIPIVPRFNAQIWLLLDSLWHRAVSDSGELGDSMSAYLSSRPGFRVAFRNVIAAMMELESDWNDTAGVVFHLRKPSA